MGSSRAWLSRNLAPIVRALQYLPSFFAKFALGRLERHWTQTYAVIGIVSNAFIVFAAFIVGPTLTVLEPKFTILGLVVGVITAFIVFSYRVFLNKVHQKTVELSNSGPCRLKLIILRIHMKRPLISAIVFSTNLVLVAFLFLGVPIPFLTQGIPLFFLFNVTFLTDFRLEKNKDVDIAFEAVQQLKALPTFYKTMTMRIIRDRIKKRLGKQIPLAGGINPNSFLRSFYLDHAIPDQPPAYASQTRADLHKAMQQDGDVLGVLTQPYPKSLGETEVVRFDLPWERRFNWGRWGLIVLSIIDALAALYILHVIDFLLRLLSL